MHRGLAGTLVLVLAASAAAAAAVAASDDDPWVGKTRADVIRALGEPTGAKRHRDHSERLVYRLVRLREGAPPGPRMLAIEVAGVGTLYRVLAPLRGEPGLDAAGIDETDPGGGAGTGGSLRGNTSYDPDTKELSRDWDLDDSVELAGKVRLTFELGPDGSVEAWSVSPKSARR